MTAGAARVWRKRLDDVAGICVKLFTAPCSQNRDIRGAGGEKAGGGGQGGGLPKGSDHGDGLRLVIAQLVAICAVRQVRGNHLQHHLLQVAIRCKALQPLHLYNHTVTMSTADWQQEPCLTTALMSTADWQRHPCLTAALMSTAEQEPHSCLTTALVCTHLASSRTSCLTAIALVSTADQLQESSLSTTAFMIMTNQL